MDTLILSNGAQIHKFGAPKLFLIGGIHGEEIAPVLALEGEIERAYTTEMRTDKAPVLENVWVLPCLNMEGREQQNRYYREHNLNSEFKETSYINFMQELVVNILQKYDIGILVDMHEDTDAHNDYIWNTFYNPSFIDNQVSEFCKKLDIGMTYQPEVEFYRGTCGDFGAEQNNINATFTTETMQYAPIEKRVERNKEYIKFFKSLI